ncbi:putative periplasmic serine endoprotease DegP-like precursor [Pseudobythopirellula maris]|uniref:Putative periplasmic serine endoprotease DegP-like n=1 Tax=Pseudobythopirellula maris TaxID=2527991 RepID=A0A5C5ZTN3_9BACT|nr:trypsin-like peptidase domain-containing protein [Pseudobythopirellula maris]TWT90445.1 putative periplasmic serine endoprotease DegP-like precursor [Pseudobythopirellula maris]
MEPSSHDHTPHDPAFKGDASHDDSMVSPPATPTSLETAAPVGPASDSPYAKPNLVIKDPDPYAFANRIRRLTIALCVISCVALAPFLYERLGYQSRRGQLRADYEFASEHMGEIAPRMVEFSMASRMVAMRAGPSVVSIHRPGARGQMGQGSGVVVDAKGYIVTNHHVIGDAPSLIVEMQDGSTRDATVVGSDPAMDLAVLKVDANGLIAAEWGDSERLEVGDLVWALGSPFGLSSSMTFGIVSAKSRRSGSGVTRALYQEFLQTDVAINPGNSGGPLVDVQGRVVGINTAILGDSYRGVSFAIPSEFAKDIYLKLRDNGHIERGYLGIEPQALPEVARRAFGLDFGEGVWVAQVMRPSPAQLGGLRQGDVILSWNDHAATDPTLLSREIAASDIGSTAEVSIKRMVAGEVVEQMLEVEVGRSSASGR